MGLRDWSAKRILGIWTGWMSGLLVALLGGIVLNPTGVTLRMAGAEAHIGVRIALAAVGLIAVCTPPAILTYVWYIQRLRAWSVRGERARDVADLERGARPDDARLLSEGEARPLGHRAYERSELGRPGRRT